MCVLEKLKVVLDEVRDLPLEDRVHVLNEMRRHLHEISPFQGEPVDCLQWVRESKVKKNAYNPNNVGAPEMELLKHSIRSDGYTQPIVAFKKSDGSYEVVDGFHRNLVGKTDEEIKERIHGYLPLVVINEGRKNITDRMAATIRHNRARGRHQIGAMSDIVVELARRRWSDQKIAKELGMTADEVLRLKQITGLAEVFQDREFSEAWEVILPSTSED